jgi:hypothetical protein
MAMSSGMPMPGSAVTTIATDPYVHSRGGLVAGVALMASLYARTTRPKGSEALPMAPYPQLIGPDGTAGRCDTRSKMARSPRPTESTTSGQQAPRRVLDFVAFAARPMPLLTLLDEAPRASR